MNLPSIPITCSLHFACSRVNRIKIGIDEDDDNDE